MTRLPRFLLLWVPVLAWCALIYALSDIPDLGTGLGVYDLILRKIAHMVEYAVLCGLLWRALSDGRDWPPAKLAYLTWGLCFAYAVSDEWHQGYVPGRVPSMMDVGLDSLGAGLASAFQARQGSHFFAGLASLARRGRIPALLLCLAATAGCGRLSFTVAKVQERAGRPEQALKRYLQAADQSPRSRWAPDAYFRAARISADVFADYDSARRLYEQILTEYGDRKTWTARAEWGLFNTPNYFPLVKGGRWDEGDSATGGRNALIKIVSRSVPKDPGAVLFVHDYYAGRRRVKDLSVRKTYRKQDFELREFAAEGDAPTVVLKYPFEKGSSWSSRRGGTRLLYAIDGTETVKVRAGTFADCLKVREAQEGLTSSWKVSYYAPGIGKVLTTLGSPAGERRNTELLSYSLPDKGEALAVGAGAQGPAAWFQKARRLFKKEAS
jgi:VanZ family protein